jgi:hypothetical protein
MKALKKTVPVILILAAFGFWLAKTLNFFEVEQKNDRIEINNSVVATIKDLQSKMEGPQALFEQFLRLDELDESQQRGTWSLLEIVDYKHQTDIDAALKRLDETFSDKELADQVLREPAKNLIESYTGYDTVYIDIAKKIKAKDWSPEQLQSYLSEQYYKLAEMSETAFIEFQSVQQQYIKGQ